jgi:menaquinone-dependent protoporphyrinogen oxidase
MTVLVAYASRYGATAEIAERIALTLIAEGVDARAQQITAVHDLAGVDAFVVGSAVYFGSWLKPATAFVERHRDTLSGRPVWLFSSGPLPGAVVPDRVAGRTAGESNGAVPASSNGKVSHDEAQPKGVDELVSSVAARGHHVFDGALDPHKLGARDKLIRTLPAGKALLPQVDGRDWDAIESWAKEIATALKD